MGIDVEKLGYGLDYKRCHLKRFTFLWCLALALRAPVTQGQFPPPSLSTNPFLLGVPVDLFIPQEPKTFKGTDHRYHLAYELHISSFSKTDLLLEELEVLDGAGDKVIASYKNKDLERNLQHKAGRAGNRNLPAGKRAVVFIWLDFDGADVLQNLRHRLRVSAPAFPRFGLQTVVGGPTRVSGEARMIGPPLRGGPWWAANGPSNNSGHRRTLIAVDGRARIPERFASDWAREENGDLFKGDSSKNSSYYGYGAEVLAVSDGTVVSVSDYLVENVPESETRAVPMNLKSMGGNFIILDIGQQQFAFYAHLQPHSVRVKLGDHVVRGQVLALVGNSGNATGPHLHFQLSDANSELGTEGLPFVIDSLELVGNVSGDDFKPLAPPEREERVLPLEDDVVRFP
jgi:murein DD-endopeptidase